MGGQLIKGYAIQGEVIAPAGLARTWKLYKSKKESSHTIASLFLIEKRQIKKNDREDILKLGRKEAAALTRMRHPGVLAVLEPLTEDDNILAYLTERIDCSLAFLLTKGKFQEYVTSELELKLILYPLIQTLTFIHEDLKQVHLAISLQHLYLTPEGKCKLSGFGHNQPITGDELQSTSEKFYDLSFAAPQLAINRNFNRSSDVFSLGVLIIRLLEAVYGTYKHQTISDKAEYEKQIGEFKKLVNTGIIGKTRNPQQLKKLLQGMLAWEPQKRFSVDDVARSRWMNDGALITVKYLDRISAYENKQQLQFLKGLAGVLEDFDTRVLTRIVFPKLMDLLKFSHLIASVVYIVLDVLKKGRLPADQFKKIAWPALRSVTQGKQLTAQAIYLFVLNMEKLQKFVGEADTTTYLLPLYLKCFDCPPKLKTLALSTLQKISKKIDYQFFKSKVIPKLLVTLKDPSLQIRKDSLKALYGVIRLIDSQTISLSILPGLEAARKVGSDPFVNAIINSIYRNLASNLPCDIISSKILPVLIPYLSDPSINRVQFQQFKNTIMDMLSKIEKDREKTFDNTTTIAIETHNFTQNDFRFQQQDTSKAQVSQESSPNYSFLSNYIQVKKETPPQSQNQIPSSQQQNTPLPQVQPVPFSQIKSPEIVANEIKLENIGSMGNQILFPPYGPTIPTNEFTPKVSLPVSYDIYGNIPKTGFAFDTEVRYDPDFESFKSYSPPVIPKVEEKKKQSYYEPPSLDFGIQQKKEDLKYEEKKSPIISSSPESGGKKFVGPSPLKKKISQQQKEGAQSFNFDYLASNPPLSTTSKVQQPSFNMNLDDFGDFRGGGSIKIQPPKQQPVKPISKPISKPPEPVTLPTIVVPQIPASHLGGITLGLNKLGSQAPLPAKSPLTNPFSQLEHYGKNNKNVPKSNDIYSYFQEESSNTDETKEGGGLDLI